MVDFRKLPRIHHIVSKPNFQTLKATISWSVGLCVAGGAVLRYEIQLKNKIDSELNNNDENTVGNIERPNQDKQGKVHGPKKVYFGLLSDFKHMWSKTFWAILEYIVTYSAL